ncbi:lipopolysaccharide biosynthesis protein [Magnetococcales bacterium HHB-1]
MADLKQKVLTAVGWSAAGRLSAQLLSWAATILIIRILTPEDYGLMAMAAVTVEILFMFSEGGLGMALVQRKTLTDALIRQIFALLILFNTLLFLALFFAAPLIALFFNEPRLVAMIRILDLQFIFLLFTIIPSSLLQRQMDFKRKSIIDFIATTLSSILSLTLAFTGFGVWALVVGAMVRPFCLMIGMNWIVRRWFKPDFSPSGLKQVFSFGFLVTADRFLWTLYAQNDSLVIGKTLGKESLGVYAVAMHLAALPMKKGASILNEVAVSAFAKVQNEPDLIREHLLKATRLVGLLSFPLFFGLSATALEITLGVLGEKWHQAVLPLQLLTLAMPLRMLTKINAPALFGIGHPEVNVGNMARAVLVMPVAFFAGSFIGLAGVSLAWITAYPLLFFWIIRRSLPFLHVPIKRYFQALYPPLLSAIIMWLAVAFLRWLLKDLGFDWPPLLMLLMLACGGAAVYLSVILLFFTDYFKEAYDLLQRRKSRKSAKDTDKVRVSVDKKTVNRTERSDYPKRLPFSDPPDMPIMPKEMGLFSPAIKKSEQTEAFSADHAFKDRALMIKMLKRRRRLWRKRRSCCGRRNRKALKNHFSKW